MGGPARGDQPNAVQPVNPQIAQAFNILSSAGAGPRPVMASALKRLNHSVWQESVRRFFGAARPRHQARLSRKQATERQRSQTAFRAKAAVEDDSQSQGLNRRQHNVLKYIEI
jgi:hypothetical protein